MEPDRNLERLADLAGIVPRFWDIFGGYYETTPDAMRAILAAMGFDVGTPAAVAESLRAWEEKPWRDRLPAAHVARLGRGETRIPLTIAARHLDRPFRWRLTCDNGVLFEDEFRPAAAEALDERDIDGERMSTRALRLPTRFAPGYHHLVVEGAGERAETRVIAAPSRCHIPDWFERGERIWGLGCHLYAVRSAANWGIGDFGTLTRLVDAAVSMEADFVGINPLHATLLRQPCIPSPYSPSSRRFISPLYLDVTAVPEYDAIDAASGRNSAPVKALRAAAHVDYDGVVDLKLRVLRALHAAFEKRHPRGDATDARRVAFEAFRTERGEALERYAIYQGLKNRFGGAPWSNWPAAFHDPGSPEVRRFAAENADEVSYHVYIQWQLDTQLAEVAARARTRGMALGLFGDLAVGVEPGGADAWANQGLIVAGMRFGAPPDAFSPLGQNWGNPPPHPLLQRARAYEPFADILRANMRHMGALRIDHVMSLMRLYWIPEGASPKDGAYVRYPMDDLLGVLALESHRNRCMVIGEDLGTVPDGFRERMEAEGVLSYRVFHFERYESGLFKRPDRYPASALAVATTHDLPTIIGHWKGNDLAARRRLGLTASAEAIDADDAARARDRAVLVAALVDQGLLDPGFPTRPEDTSNAQLLQLTMALERYLARTPSRLMMVNLDDVLREVDQLNLPGTVDEHPNWRRKIAVPVDSIATDRFARDVCKAVADERAGVTAEDAREE